MPVEYSIRPCLIAPTLGSGWNDDVWKQADTIEIAQFRPESSAHRPQTFARLLYDADGLHGIFMVRDRYVRCVRTNYFDEVWKDSCVEFFVRPKPDGGYFNFEFNCGGAHLCNYITDWTRSKEGFANAVKLPPHLGLQVKTKSSLPPIVDPERSDPTDWLLNFFIPKSVLEEYVGPLGNWTGQTWHGNFFKCAEEVSHPHWAAWSRVDAFNFHLPHCFGKLNFQ